MKVAILTEGDSEFSALPHLANQFREACSLSSYRVIKVAVTPDAPVGQVARQCAERARVAALAGADFVVVLLDREQQADCCGLIAESIRSGMLRYCEALNQIRLAVVLKDRKFENWLVADLEALRAQPARFNVTAALSRSVSPNKADSTDAELLIKRAAIGSSYDKRADAGRICRQMDILRAGANSRSFRHLLHVLEHPTYKDQCKRVPEAQVPSQPKRSSRPRTGRTGR
ncbi:DUF4276 family protein [Micromonospora sp. WMMC250]|uniref:DUF4276 family protein n=1 Tax=Micromonospora sp. WMMC250 TaxID=3014781 RepID=UPI003FA5F321